MHGFQTTPVSDCFLERGTFRQDGILAAFEYPRTAPALECLIQPLGSRPQSSAVGLPRPATQSMVLKKALQYLVFEWSSYSIEACR